MFTATDVLERTVEAFVNGLVDALPSIVSGLLFLVVAYVAVSLVRRLLRATLRRVYPADQRPIVDFAVLIVTLLMWFAAGLVFLKVLGLGDIAASLGTATGFVALGVAYALSEMLEDAVAGVYLLRDPDFNPGDTVTAAGTTGTVSEIGLRKSRFEQTDGDTVVVANRDVESKWTKERAGTEAIPADAE